MSSKGTTEVPIFDAAEPCEHPHEILCTLYVCPDPDEEEDDLGWHKDEGCKACVTELGGVFFCGGLYPELRMFEGEVELS